MYKPILKKLLLVLVGIVISMTLNFVILYNILMPDECYYCVHKTNFIIEVLYDFKSENGYRPFPSSFNFSMTIIIGFCIGLFIGRKIKLKNYF